MPKIRIDIIDDYQPYKQKVPRRKEQKFEEFKRDSSKRNKRNKKNPLDQRSQDIYYKPNNNKGELGCIQENKS